MALIPKDTYSGQLDTTDPVGYPHGKAQNITVSGDGTGTPWEKDLANDILGAQQALLDEGGITPDGNPDKVGASQYVEALLAIIDAEAGALATDNENRIDDIEAITSPGSNPRKSRVSALKAAPGWDATAGRPHWTMDSTPATSAHDLRKAYSSTGMLQWSFGPNDGLPSRCTVTEIHVHVTPAAARAVGNRMQLAYSTLFLLTPATTVAGEDDGTTDQQVLSATGLSIQIDDADPVAAFTPLLLVRLRAGIDSPPVDDLAHLCEVVYTLERL